MWEEQESLCALDQPLDFLKYPIEPKPHPKVEAPASIEITVNEFYDMIAVPNTPFTVLFLSENNYKVPQQESLKIYIPSSKLERTITGAWIPTNMTIG